MHLNQSKAAKSRPMILVSWPTHNRLIQYFYLMQVHNFKNWPKEIGCDKLNHNWVSYHEPFNVCHTHREGLQRGPWRGNVWFPSSYTASSFLLSLCFLFFLSPLFSLFTSSDRPPSLCRGPFYCNRGRGGRRKKVRKGVTGNSWYAVYHGFT